MLTVTKAHGPPLTLGPSSEQQTARPVLPALGLCTLFPKAEALQTKGPKA